MRYLHVLLAALCSLSVAGAAHAAPGPDDLYLPLSKAMIPYDGDAPAYQAPPSYPSAAPARLEAPSPYAAPAASASCGAPQTLRQTPSGAVKPLPPRRLAACEAWLCWPTPEKIFLGCYIQLADGRLTDLRYYHLNGKPLDRTSGVSAQIESGDASPTTRVVYVRPVGYNRSYFEPRPFSYYFARAVVHQYLCRNRRDWCDRRDWDDWDDGYHRSNMSMERPWDPYVRRFQVGDYYSH